MVYISLRCRCYCLICNIVLFSNIVYSNWYGFHTFCTVLMKIFTRLDIALFWLQFMSNKSYRSSKLTWIPVHFVSTYRWFAIIVRFDAECSYCVYISTTKLHHFTVIIMQKWNILRANMVWLNIFAIKKSIHKYNWLWWGPVVAVRRKSNRNLKTFYPELFDWYSIETYDRIDSLFVQFEGV